MQPATLKRGRASSAVRALGYALLLSARPALFIAVLVFGWLFSGWPETWREVLRPPSVPEADAAAPAGQWWSMSYPFREKITAAGQAKNNLLTYDGVHMKTEGNEVMATGVLKAFGLNDAERG